MIIENLIKCVLINTSKKNTLKVELFSLYNHFELFYYYFLLNHF